MQVCESGFEVLEVAYTVLLHIAATLETLAVDPDVQQKHVILSLSLFSHRLHILYNLLYYLATL
jgi:hypothetical protein